MHCDDCCDSVNSGVGLRSLGEGPYSMILGQSGRRGIPEPPRWDVVRLEVALPDGKKWKQVTGQGGLSRELKANASGVGRDRSWRTFEPYHRVWTLLSWEEQGGIEGFYSGSGRIRLRMITWAVALRAGCSRSKTESVRSLLRWQSEPGHGNMTGKQISHFQWIKRKIIWGGPDLIRWALCKQFLWLPWKEESQRLACELPMGRSIP